MSKTDRLLAPRDAATDDDDSNEGSQAASDYDSEGSLDDNPETESVVDKPVGTGTVGGVSGEPPAGDGTDEEEDSSDKEDDDDEEEEKNEGFKGGRGQEVGEVQEEDVNERKIRGRGRQKASREPYEVPTSGAFYMHDDRFAAEGPVSNTRGTHRRKKNGIDDKKWKHDKFEELERDYELGKPIVPRGRRGQGSRGGRGRGDGRLRERGGYNKRGYEKPYIEEDPLFVENQPYADPGRRQDFDDGDRWKKNSEYHQGGGAYPTNGNGVRTGRKSEAGRTGRGGGGAGGRGYSSRGR